MTFITELHALYTLERRYNDTKHFKKKKANSNILRKPISREIVQTSELLKLTLKSAFLKTSSVVVSKPGGLYVFCTAGFVRSRSYMKLQKQC